MSQSDIQEVGEQRPSGRAATPLLSVLAGLVAALVAAVLWAVIVAGTRYQIGIIAVGIGFAVGYAMAFVMGRTARPTAALAPVAALLALLGCVSGDLLTDLIVQARFEEVPLGDALRLTASHPSLAREIFAAHFSAMDVVFWAIAAWTAYRLVRRVTRAAAETGAAVATLPSGVPTRPSDVDQPSGQPSGAAPEGTGQDA